MVNLFQDKTMRIFDYIYFRIYSFYNSKDNIPEIYAIVVITLIQLLLFLNLTYIIEIILGYQPFAIGKFIIVIVYLSLIALNWIRFVVLKKGNKVQRIWENKNDRPKFIYDYLIILLIMILFILPILKGTNNI